MKQDHRTFLDFKAYASRRAAVLTPKPVKRARGGRTERSPGGADVDHDQPRRSRRPTGERSRKTLGAMSGAAAKHRADRPSRRRQKFADGGAPYSASAMPYGGGPSFIPAVQVAPGRFTAPAVPNQPDYTQQMINMLGHDWPIRKPMVRALLAASACRVAAHLATRRVMLCKIFAWIRSGCRLRAVAWCASAAGGSNGGKDGSNEHRSRQTDRFLGAAH